MLCKIQCSDINYFQIPSTTTTPVNLKISISAPETLASANKNRELRQTENPNGLPRRIDTNHRQTLPVRSPVVEKHHSSRLHRFIGVSDREKSQTNEVLSRNQNGITGLVNAAAAKHRKGWGSKMRTKCSTKWATYGGCIPAILRALETIDDLDEAFRPWEDRLSNKERTIILKEQLSWERAFEIFEWFKRKGCYEINVIHYNIMLRISGKAHKWDEVERLCNEMLKNKVRPINSTYGTLIDVYSKGGLREEAVLWLQRMKEQGLEPDEVTMGIVVQMYKKAGEFKKAEEFFKMWSSCKPTQQETTLTISNHGVTEGGSGAHLSLSSYTYNTLIDTYGKAGQLQEVSETFDRMLSEGVVPDTITFNTMIHVFGNHGRLEEVISLYQTMEQLKCPPDTRTFNILISLFAKHNDISRAVGYFMKMKTASLDPDPVSYRTLLYALSIRYMVREAEELVSEMDSRCLKIDEFTQSALIRMYIGAGMLEKSWQWFERFHFEGNMSSECYSANIDAYGQHGHVSEAEKAFLCCQKRRKLSVLEFNVMIKAYGIDKRYDKACKLFDSMKNHGVVPDRCSHVSLIQMLASADLPQIAKTYLQKMQEAGLVSDCIPYCAVISSFAKLGQLDSAERLFKEMIGYDIQPDVIVFGVLINAFAETGDVKEAICYVDYMKKEGLPMNDVICNSLIKLYTKVGYLKEAEETFQLLRESEGGPTVFSSNCMIDLYSEQLMVDKAEAIFEDMKRKGNANEFSYAMILCMYKRIGKIEEAIKIAKMMQELGLLSDLLSCNSVLGLFAMDGRAKEAIGIFREMIFGGIQPDDCTFKSLGVVLVKSGVPREAVSKLESERKKDEHAGVREWTSALNSLVGGDDRDLNDNAY